MKIVCTEEERNHLVESLVETPECPFAVTHASQCDAADCRDCLERKITWEITASADEETETLGSDSTTSYQLGRAKSYLENRMPNDGSEPTEEWCIISDLLRIIRENKEKKGE